MGKVIEVDFTADDGTGYFKSDSSDEISGVYAGEFAACMEDDVVYAGVKCDVGVDDAVILTKNEMNEFCLMWLGLFAPELFQEEEDTTLH